MQDGSLAEPLLIQVPGTGAEKLNSRKGHPGLCISCSPIEIHSKQAIHLVKQYLKVLFWGAEYLEGDVLS